MLQSETGVFEFSTSRQAEAILFVDHFSSVTLNSSTFHRNPMATPYDARLIAAVHLRRLMSRYDTLLKSNSERPGGNESTPIINLRDLFLSVSRELEE